MHRSGTSMLARAMREFGVFMGRNRTRNDECRWTNQLNYWIFRQASATWERPEGMDSLLVNPELCGLIEDYLEGVVSGPASIRYAGLRRWVRAGTLFGIQEPWGWKDPRNTYTLPFWLRIFPQARVLHITRHGVDVAQSLLQRHKKAATAAANRYRRRRRLYVNNPFAPKNTGFAHNPRVSSLEGGLALWKAYMTRGFGHVRELGSQALELRYEDLLLDPVPNLERILKFCGLQVEEKKLQDWSENLRSDRAYAYRNDPQLQALALQNRDLLAEYGYSE